MNNKFSIIKAIKNNLLIVLSISGIISAIWFTNAYGGDKYYTPNSLTSPPSSPYENNISGIGFIEASSRNINVGAFAPGIVSEVLVKEGQEISAGEPLFIQDQRIASANVQAAKEEVQVAESSLKLARIEVADRTDSYDRVRKLKSGVSVTTEEVANKKFAVEKAKQDILIKENLINLAKAKLNLAEIELERTVVRSPINGLVLKVRVQPGEFISGNEREDESPVFIGNNKPLYIRVQIDENDLWRFDNKMAAHAYIRSNKDINSSLSFVRLEPFAGPKDQLRGTGRELIDTRIVEIIYKIDKDLKDLYIGQQMDVFIESSNPP